MRVFQVSPDVNNYQYFLLQDSGIVSSDQLRFDGTVMERWEPPAVYSYKPQLRAGDFWGFQMKAATWATTPSATNLLTRFLASAGQILPLPYQGEAFGLLNVTECVECLDPDRTEWILGSTTGKPIQIAKYAFLQNRLPESAVFKIPQTARGEILCYEGLRDPEDEFKPTVERLGLKGLQFREIWNSEASGDD